MHRRGQPSPGSGAVQVAGAGRSVHAQIIELRDWIAAHK